MAGRRVAELYATNEAYDAHALVREIEGSGVPTYIVEERSAAKISDLQSPPGIVAVAETLHSPIEQLFWEDGLVLVLADMSDPGNVGTLMRSAEAFGVTRVAIGRLGADPYHPKVVRAAMGALFRLRIALADPLELSAAAAAGWTIVGLAAAGTPLARFGWPTRCVMVVGQERHGLGRWEDACAACLAIPMCDPVDSLNASVAGSIALYEAAKRAAPGTA
ncbi:MAG: RNA methyltransferase [Candidatus Eremiobacteraeota bacterium]|nr:RNA methyltransferase [Candidatus Eremiobacteraeota bacterium]